MFRRLSTRALATLLVASMLVLPGGAVALGAEGGTGPADALSPTGEWVPLAVGQQVWYAFKSDGSTSPVLIRMGVAPSNSATFGVWTPDDVREWAAGEKPSPVGAGAKNDFLGGDLAWQSSLELPGTYYVAVDQTGPLPGNFKLNISGNGVSFLPAAAATTAAAAPAAKPAAAAKAMPAAEVTKAGTGPDDALTPSGEWAPLAKGQQVWYALPQDGGGSKILVRMAVEPKSSATFKILTPEQVRLWSVGQPYDPVGSGAASDAFGGDAVWTGSFKAPGTYYILVEQTGANAGGYKLSVN